MSAPYTLPLTASARLTEAVAGGKGAGLAWLAATGQPVPPGFVITTAAFRALGPLAAGEAIRTAPLPAAVLAAISRSYAELGGPVAVRSSLVGEDSREASFAGQLDTFLNVDGEAALLAAVRQCWASAFHPRLARYRAEHGPATPPLMAVVVQRMAAARVAGVAFTRHPLTGEDRVVIEAARGLGEAVVSGRVTPDHWELTPDGAWLTEQPATPGEPVLTPAQVRRVAAMAQAVATRAGQPQDVEWAWDGAAWYLLQARPITTAQQTVYSSKFVSEMVPGLIKPLVWSTTTSAIAHNVFGRVFDALLGPGVLSPEGLVRRFHGRVYANLTLLGRFCEGVGLPRNFFEAITRDEPAERQRARRALLSLNNLPAKLRLIGFAWRQARAASEIRAFLDRRPAQLAPWRAAAAEARSPADLLAAIEAVGRLHGEAQWFIFITGVNLAVRNRLLGRLAHRAQPGLTPGDLLRGRAGPASLGPVLDLEALAAQARALPPAEFDGLVAGAPPPSAAAAALTGAVDAFLARHGFLSASGTDFSLPTWREQPELVWAMIRRLALSPEAPPPGPPAITPALVRDRLGLAQRWWFDQLLPATQRYLELREHVSRAISESANLLRQLFLQLADHWTAAGVLAARDDIFFLSLAEVRALAAGDLPPASAADRIRAERRALAEDAELLLPETVVGELARALAPEAGRPSAHTLTGRGASPGQARGLARVVHDPAQAPADLSRRDILVVPFTDIGWTPLLARVGGIVAETGGQLSHTAIVAREYGRPAVVSVRAATRLVREGQTLVVDGTRGQVHLDPTAVDDGLAAPAGAQPPPPLEDAP